MIKYEFDDTTSSCYARKYCMPLMFDCFVCAFLSFCACEFTVKYETQEPRKTIVE